MPSAGLARRLAAGVYDWLLVIALMMVLSVPVVAWRAEPVQPGNWAYRLAMLLVAAGFFCTFWARGGQTLGMRAWRLRLVTAAGAAVGWQKALQRFCWAWLSLLPAGAGFWWVLLDHEGLSWHDRLSGTRLLLLPAKKRARPVRKSV